MGSGASSSVAKKDNDAKAAAAAEKAAAAAAATADVEKEAQPIRELASCKHEKKAVATEKEAGAIHKLVDKTETAASKRAGKLLSELTSYEGTLFRNVGTGSVQFLADRLLQSGMEKAFVITANITVLEQSFTITVPADDLAVNSSKTQIKTPDVDIQSIIKKEIYDIQKAVTMVEAPVKSAVEQCMALLKEVGQSDLPDSENFSKMIASGVEIDARDCVAKNTIVQTAIIAFKSSLSTLKACSTKVATALSAVHKDAADIDAGRWPPTCTLHKDITFAVTAAKALYVALCKTHRLASTLGKACESLLKAVEGLIELVENDEKALAAKLASTKHVLGEVCKTATRGIAELSSARGLTATLTEQIAPCAKATGEIVLGELIHALQGDDESTSTQTATKHHIVAEISHALSNFADYLESSLVNLAKHMSGIVKEQFGFNFKSVFGIQFTVDIDLKQVLASTENLALQAASAEERSLMTN